MQTVPHPAPRMAPNRRNCVGRQSLTVLLTRLWASRKPGVVHDWAALERDLKRFLSPKAVVSRREELLVYDCDGLTMDRHAPPLAVLPRSTEEVAAIVAACHRYSIPFVARGSGTGLSGGALVEEDALLIVTSRMRRILDVDLSNQTITVETRCHQQLGDPCRRRRWLLLRARSFQPGGSAASVGMLLRTLVAFTASNMESRAITCCRCRLCCLMAR